MTSTSPDRDPLDGVEFSRRELIRRIVVGSAFAVPVVASFDMASLGVSTASANSPNQASNNPAFLSPAVATFVVGTAQTFDIITPGAPVMVVTQSGALPSGIIFTPINTGTNSSDVDATLSGTAAAGTGGVYPIVLEAANGGYPSAHQNFTLTVNQAPSFTSAATASVNSAASGTVSIATSGYPNATITQSGTLPPGMSFAANAANGTATISGKPTAAGIYKVTLTASNGVGTAATQTLTVTVQDGPAFTSAATATFSSAASSSFEITTTGTPAATVAITSGSLPSGLSFAANPASGTATISGQPATAAGGTYQLTLTAENGITPNATQSFQLSVDLPPNDFITTDVKTSGTNAIICTVKVPGPGTVDAVITSASGGAGTAAAATRKPKSKRVTLGKLKAKARHSGKLKLKIKLNSAGRALVASNSQAELWLTVTFTPTDGKPSTHTVRHLHV